MIKLHLFLDIINLIFPKTYYTCKSVLVKYERVLCLKCYVDLPKHFNRQNIHQLIVSVNGNKYKYHYDLCGIIKKPRTLLLGALINLF